jgi:hypothetical protein
VKQSVTTFQDSSSFESSSASDGKYNSSGLLTESRRNSLSCSLLARKFFFPPKLEKRSPNVHEERTGEVECEGDLEEPHRLEKSESLVVERIVEP